MLAWREGPLLPAGAGGGSSQSVMGTEHSGCCQERWEAGSEYELGIGIGSVLLKYILRVQCVALDYVS